MLFSLYAIFSKVGLKTELPVLSSLIETCCLPILLFAAESLKWNASTLQSAENAYSQAYYKMFNTFDKTVICQCQYYLGQLTAELKIDIRKINFLSNIARSNNITLLMLNQLDSELQTIYNKYSINQNKLCNVKNYIWKYFESLVGCL